MLNSLGSLEAYPYANGNDHLSPSQQKEDDPSNCNFKEMIMMWWGIISKWLSHNHWIYPVPVTPLVSSFTAPVSFVAIMDSLESFLSIHFLHSCSSWWRWLPWLFGMNRRCQKKMEIWKFIAWREENKSNPVNVSMTGFIIVTKGFSSLLNNRKTSSNKTTTTPFQEVRTLSILMITSSLFQEIKSRPADMMLMILLKW